MANATIQIKIVRNEKGTHIGYYRVLQGIGSFSRWFRLSLAEARKGILTGKADIGSIKDCKVVPVG